MRSVSIALCLLAVLPSPALPCSICTLGLGNAQTWRQEAADAKLIIYGSLSNPKLNSDATGTGTTDLRVAKLLKANDALRDRKVIILPRYIPVDPQQPPQYIVFCDVTGGKNGDFRIDPYRGAAVKSDAAASYLAASMALDPKDRMRSLLFFFDYLDHREPEIANDAFLEFAKATDDEIGKVAPKLSPAKLRRWLADGKTPTDRLGLYALLLGGCGREADAAFLREMIVSAKEPTSVAIDGLLCGFIQLREKDGWDLLQSLLADTTSPFPQRFGALRAARFFHAWKPEATRKQVLRGLSTALTAPDISDLAIEDLRKWQWWDLTSQVLELYQSKPHDSPLVRRAIARYALTCPRPEGQRFIEELRRRDPELVKDVEDLLQYDKEK